jgi:hypothetical protein
MSVNLHAAVTAWLAKSVPAELDTAGFARIDIDALLEVPPPLAVETGLVCLELATILARQDSPDVDGSLTIPLPASDTMAQDSPTIQELLAQVWEYGPGRDVPVLSLVEPRRWRQYADVEEYRRHLQAEDSLPPGYAAYYRTWRTQEEMTPPWCPPPSNPPPPQATGGWNAHIITAAPAKYPSA